MKIAGKNISPQLISLADQGTVSASNFLVSILLARALGLETFGEFSLILIGNLLVLALQQALIISPMQTFLPAEPDHGKRQYINQLFTAQLAIAILSALAMGASAIFLSDWLLNLRVYYVVAYVFLFALLTFFRKLAFCTHEPQLSLWITGVNFGLRFLCIAALVFSTEYSLTTALGVYVVFAAAGAVIGLLQHRPSVTLNWNREWLIRDVLYSRWLAGTALLQWFAGNYFLIVASEVLGMAALGAIRIAQNIMGFIAVLFQALDNVMPVEMSRQLQQKGLPGLYRYTRATALAWLLPVVGLLAIVVSFAGLILGVTYGTAFEQQAWVLQSLAGAYIFTFLLIPAVHLLRVLTITRAIFVAYACSTAFSLLCARLFITTWGISGVIAGIYASQAFILGVTVLFIYQEWNKRKAMSHPVAIG